MSLVSKSFVPVNDDLRCVKPMLGRNLSLEILEKGVKTIGDSSFEVAEITLGESSKLSEIGKRAFKSCLALKSFPFDEAYG